MNSTTDNTSVAPPLLSSPTPALGSEDRKASDQRISAFFLLVSLGLASGGAWFLLENELGWRCVFLEVLQLPCGFCGTTRSLGAIAAGQISAALSWNPLVVLTTFGVILWSVIQLANPEILNRRFPWGLLAYAGSVLFLLNWIYLIFNLPR